MRHAFFPILLLSWMGTAFSQTASMQAGGSETATAQAAGELQAKRLEIESVRARETARLDAADAKCQTRFAVNDCLRVSQLERRTVMTDLRKQESRLNELERSRRGAEQVELSRKKALEHAQQKQEADAAHAANLEAQAQKQKEQAQKREANRSIPTDRAASSPPVPNAPTGPSSAEQASNRADFERRQAEAQEHRSELQKRQREKTGKPASTLPVPP